MRFHFLTLLVLATWCLPLTAGEKLEPKYRGKPLAYWVERIQKAEKIEEQNEAADAIAAFGLDAAPRRAKIAGDDGRPLGGLSLHGGASP